MKIGTVALCACLLASTLPGATILAPKRPLLPGGTERPQSLLSPASVRLSPLGITGGTRGAGALLDRDTTTRFALSGAERLEVAFESASPIQALKVFDPAPLLLRLFGPGVAGWEELDTYDLSALPHGWSRLPVRGAPVLDRVLVELTPLGAPGAPGVGVAEIEFWSESALACDSGDPQDLLARIEGGAPPFEARLLPARPAGRETFAATLPWDARELRRAYLVYELRGLSDWSGVSRSVNGKDVPGVALSGLSSQWHRQIEEIDPDLLSRGENRIVFDRPAGLDAPDTLREVALLVEVDDGRNFVDPSEPDPSGLVSLYFQGAIQLEGAAVEIAAPLSGRVDVAVLDGNGFASTGISVLAGDLKEGWNLIPLPVGTEGTGLRLIPSSTGDGLRRVVAIGSGVGRIRMPARLRVTYPDAGQFVGREAYLRGFVSPADDGTGAATVTVAGVPAEVRQGAFAALVDKDEVGLWDDADDAPWSVEVSASYPGGTVLTRTVQLTRGLAAPRSSEDWLLPGRSFQVRPDSPKRIRHDEAGLDLEAGAVDAVKDLKVTPLRDDDLPALDLGMTNVTRGPRRGYRFEPHGTRFARPVRVSLPFDPALLPAGLTEEDVRTFYFDGETGRWMALPKLGVDGAAGAILSTTDHFTDMINAAVNVPEHAQLAVHDKNAMKDVPLADPGAEIALLDPPLPGSTGEARLSYPITLPGGRLGMQPSLKIAYTSGGGDGWLGLGWDLTVPSVSVETRWGVPRYDAALETESYLLEGDPLTPLSHRAAFVPRTSDRVFHQRVEGPFRRIVRRGSSPETYTWEVTDKKGTTSWFGADPETGALDPGAVLTDDVGRIFRWLLREVRDANGNGMRFQYALVVDPGMAEGTVPGRQRYLKSIEYTRSASEPGPYTVTFVRDAELGEPRRPDVQIDAKGGFKLVTSQLLRRIDVAFLGAPVRSYDLVYGRGAFEKTLLQSITERGEDGSEFHTHRFAYYDDVRDPQGYAGFAPSATWSAGDDDVRVTAIDTLASTFGSDAGRASALSGYETEQAGAHLYAGFNPGPPTKQGSVGGKVGFSGTVRSEGLLALIDLNGDGLPDKVFRNGGDVSFRMNQSGPTGPPAFGPAIPLPTLPALSHESASSASFGAEAYPGVSVIANESLGISRAETYVSDVNGDGLPDLVHGGTVLFNHPDAGGVPSFDPDSATSPVPVEAGVVDGTGLLPDLPALQQQILDNAALHDTVRRWIAPYPGHVRVSGGVTLLPGSVAPADGVRVAIQKNGTELWSATLEADDISSHAPEGVDDVPVSRGDRLYFRLQSRNDGSHDAVAWDPEIAYVGAPALTDVNGLNPYRYKASEDFTFAGRPGTNVRAPFSGRLHLEGDLQKTAGTTDDVVVRALRNGVPIQTRVLAWDAVATASMTINFDVVEGDTIELRVFVDSPIDLTKLAWKPALFYLGPEDGAPAPTRIVDGTKITLGRVRDANGDPLIQLHPLYDIDAYPQDGLAAPQAPWVADEDEEITVTSHLVALPGTNGRVIMTAKKRGQLVAKRSVFITNGIVLNNSFTFDVEKGDEIFLDYSVGDADLAARIGNRVMRVDGDSAPTGFHTTLPQGVFPRPYRGWGVAGYKGNPPRDTSPLLESDLGKTFDKESAYDPRSSNVHLFAPSPGEGLWRGPEDQTYAGPAGMGSSRLGPDSPIVPGGAGGGRAPARVSVSRQEAASLGVAFLSGSLSSGGGRTDLDFLDLNGDRFPDVVGEGRVQYTTPRGGLESANRAIAGLAAEFRSVDSEAKNLSVGGSPATFKLGSVGLVDSPGQGTAPKDNDTGSQMVSLGLGGGLGNGTSAVKQDLVDLNGDGLPDRVRQAGGTLQVALNLGYAFAPFEPWGTGDLNEGASSNNSLGLNLGFNGGIYDYAGGLSLDRNASETTATLVDLNGDGLPDRLRRVGTELRVGFNAGSGFLPDVPWRGTPGGSFALNANASLGGGAYVTIPIGPLCIFGVCWVILNPGADVGTSLARQETALLDLDGDGYVDHVSSTDDASLTVARNTTGRTNLLRRVERPLHASFDLAYARGGNTPDQPHSRWLLSEVSLFDGLPGDGVDFQLATFRYEGGVWDRLEREFYGYARVVEELRDASAGGALYRSIVREYRTDSFYAKGLIQRERTEDGAGRPFKETEYAYRFADETGAELADLASTTATVFPGLSRIDRRFYEGQPAPGKSTSELQDYDALGNLTRQFDAGDPGAADDLEATLEYAPCTATHIVGVPVGLTVRGNGAELRRRRAAIDCTSGDLTSITAYLEDGRAAETSLEYDGFGNLTRVVLPPNAAGQRYENRYTHDPGTHTYVTAVADSFGYLSTAETDLRWGKPLRVTDANGNAITYTYDVFGRVLTVTGPYEQGGSDPTVRFDYHPEAGVPWARTRQLDRFRDASDPIDLVRFADGLSREVQRKSDATLFRGEGTPAADVMVVSGRVSFDAAGRIVDRWHPLTEPLGTPGTFRPTYDSVSPTHMELDVLDRVSRTAFPDGTEERVQRGFGQDREGATQFEARTTDRNGVLSKTYRNVRELVTAQKDLLGTTEVWTSFAYDGLDQLVRLTDDRGNVTRVTWDNLGRKTSLDSPDQGKTEAVYDLAGNQTAKVTANLRARGQRITYEHAFNRLVRIHYPDFPENDVAYTFGPPGAPGNAAGRVVRVTDGSGSEERSYGKLGEIVSETKSVASSTGPAPEVYRTEYLYDTFGRLQQLLYPDGERLTYLYDAGGKVRAASGRKGATDYPYVTRMEYDKFGHRAFTAAGNGTRTLETYRPDNQRLATIASSGPEGTFLNLGLTYDGVGNVLTRQNTVPVPPPSRFGGPTLQTYRYDDLYRLVSSEGSYQFAPNKVNRYREVLDYDTINNLTVKVQQHEVVGPSGQAVPQHKTSYDYRYVYGGAQPHAVTHAGGRTFAYDGNGNQAGWQDDQDGTRRSIVWDEENRIRSLFENGHEMRYVYDDAGERVIKRGPQGETVYVNPYFTVRNRERATKHLWVGDRRLSSKLVKANAAEQDLYFYHADQVAGTAYVSDLSGRLYEHFEYFPFGETWVEESGNTQRTPYAFTGKELDEETGLYSMGARYYDPRLSTFNSTEPLLFPQPEKGREQPKFLSAYQYAYQNPVRNVDPDGRDVLIIVGYDKDKVEHDRFVNTADSLTKSLGSDAKVHRLEIGPKGDVAKLIAAKAAEIGKGKVSTVVWVGHGETDGQGFLPRQGESLSIDDAVQAAGIVKEGSIVAIGCKVQKNIHTNELRSRQIKFYGTMDNFLFKNKTGEVSISPTRKLVGKWQKPADVALPEATRKIDPMKDDCPIDTGCVFQIGPSIVESEKRTGNAPMK